MDRLLCHMNSFQLYMYSLIIYFSLSCSLHNHSLTSSIDIAFRCYLIVLEFSEEDKVLFPKNIINSDKSDNPISHSHWKQSSNYVPYASNLANV